MKYILNICFLFNLNYMFILDCLDGYYGKNCENRCSDNCYMFRLCYIGMGYCYRGCKLGWIIIMCN